MDPQTTQVDDHAAVAAAKISERKRLKHREYVKKSYKKKVTTIENLRHELNALNEEYASILLLGTGKVQQQIDEDSCARSTQTPIMQKYLKATELKKWYQQENERLYQCNACHMKVESRIGQLLDTSDVAKAPLSRITTLPLYHISPLPAIAYAKVIDDATNDVLCFARSTKKLSTGARVLGWTDEREVHDRTLKFALQKEFGLSPRDLLQRSWSIFSNPKEFSKIYGSALDVQFHVLQHVDENTILIYRRIAPAADSTRAAKTVFLLARRQIDEGYLLLFRSIDKSLLHFNDVDAGDIPQVHMDSKAAHKPETWADMYIWDLFYNVPGEPKKCLFHFGGATTTTLWLREVLFIAVRWETMAVGSPFSLTAE